MKANRHPLFWLVLLSLVVVASPTFAAEPNDKNDPRFAVRLDDGSQLLVAFSAATLPLKTSYGKLSLPVEKIRHIAFGDKHESATVQLRDGEKITGTLEITEMHFTAVFGKVTIPLAQIREINAVEVAEKYPDISGRWLDAMGGECSIVQEGKSLIFQGASGAVSKGEFKDSKTVLAPPSPGWIGHTGEIIDGGKRILWKHAEGETWWARPNE
jgi:hypothetical protein